MVFAIIFGLLTIFVIYLIVVDFIEEDHRISKRAIVLSLFAILFVFLCVRYSLLYVHKKDSSSTETITTTDIATTETSKTVTKSANRYSHYGDSFYEDEYDYRAGFYDGQDQGYEDGYDEGHDDGYEEGYYEGKEFGYSDGYKEGFEEGYFAAYDDMGIEPPDEVPW